ncbi:peptidylprolyl isomerase [Maricaulis sp.]|uniref:peptidylprolyl isomerase n=1 Tax=Maricaulis sp. TaxID=1486257 RepID=UPI002635E98E|nr:peptidylprolyl isomerase [Maricaulis sp.]MDF1770090.1 peptidylprolyl isomerase [Maricaulis sp.]
MRFTLSASLALALTTAACARETTADTTEADAGAASAVSTAAAQETAPAPQWDLPADAWRTADQEDLLYIETDHGMVIVEMAPEFAPNHVARMRTLAQERFYDFLVWHRVIDGFMAQGGGARSNPGHAADVDGLQAEFTVRRSGEPVVTELQDRMINPRSLPQMAKAGFWDGFPAGTQTAALAAITGDGQVQSWLLHCTGAAAAARTGDPNSARSQFYITRGNPEHLNAQYTSWGRVRVGQEAVDAIAVGSAMDDPDFRPDNIRSMRTGDELPAGEQVTIEVADTDSAAFAAYLDTLRDPSGNLPDICDITVPTRIIE